MKILFIISIVILLFLSITEKEISAGTNETKHRSFNVSLGYERMISRLDKLNYFGIISEVFVSNSISLNYSFFVGATDNSRTYNNFHTFPGMDTAILCLVALSYSSVGHIDLFNNDWWYYVFLIPEGISYYVKSNEKLFIVPYLNILGCDYLSSSGIYTISSALGMKVEYKPFKILSISPFAGIKYIHSQGLFAESIGLKIEMTFDK